jgi:N-acylneuraminate cytidylyltransferase
VRPIGRAAPPPVVALIPARAGSRGIPRKNLQEVAGESLVRRAARACVAAERLDRVFVYSDGPEILQEAERAGATPVERPAEVSGDRTTSEETVLRFLRDHDIGSADLMLVQATSPFLRPAHVDEAVAVLHRRYGDLDSVVSVFPLALFLGYLAPIAAEGRESERLWRPLYPERWRRQDFEPDLYAETGALYLAKRAVWDAGRRTGDRAGIVTMSRWESVEVDDPEDLAVARALAPLVCTG